jgi:hypothetical protein
MDVAAPIFMFGCCFASLMVIAVIVGVNYSRRRDGQQVTEVIRKLAGGLGLTPLDQQRPHRIGGRHKDHTFYIEPGITGSVSSRNISLHKAVAVNLEVRMKEPKKRYAYCNRRRVSPSIDFDSAFSAKLHHEWISIPAREAMVDFVRRREDLFLDGLPIHLKPESDPKPTVRLQHNIPNDPEITAQHVLAILDDMIEVAQIIEATC